LIPNASRASILLLSMVRPETRSLRVAGHGKPFSAARRPARSIASSDPPSAWYQ
jgi:hypothetical protein